jgi:hypothetical protein
MPVNYSTAAKNARLNAVVAQIDAGAGAGKLKIRDSSNVVLATLTLADPCGTVSAGVLTFDFDPDISDTSADASGTAANAIITDDADTTVISGLTVGTSGTNVVLDSVSITAGQTVTITAGTITHAADT